jgi:hypothetical protein
VQFGLSSSGPSRTSWLALIADDFRSRTTSKIAIRRALSRPCTAYWRMTLCCATMAGHGQGRTAARGPGPRPGPRLPLDGFQLALRAGAPKREPRPPPERWRAFVDRIPKLFHDG